MSDDERDDRINTLIDAIADADTRIADTNARIAETDARIGARLDTLAGHIDTLVDTVADTNRNVATLADGLAGLTDWCICTRPSTTATRSPTMTASDHEKRAEILATLKELAQRLERDRAERDAAITAAVRAGAGQREVARAVGLSHPGVAKIVARSK